MAAIVLCFILALSLGVAVASRRGAIRDSMSDVMVANRSFGTVLLFIVAVGETYSVGTMIGVPGAIYARGASYAVWFMGYMCLGFSVGYFINPMIWRLGRLSGAVTIAETFRWRFNSKALECLVALLCIIFLMPWIQIQFAGLGVILKYIGFDISYLTAVFIATIIAYLYIAIAGIRAPAWVSILKDFLMLFSMVIGGLVVATQFPGGVEGIFQKAAEVAPGKLIVETEPITKNVTFMISTIIFQSMGLCMFPLTFQFIFTGRSEDTVRRNQIFMPLYMYMYPFLILTAYYVLITVTGLTNPDEAFMALIARELPPWLIGVVAGGGVLTAILVASLCALSIGGLLTQNIIGMFIPNLSSQKAVYITRFTTAFALLFSAFMAVFLPALMLGITNFAYYGFTQMFPVTVAAAFWGRATKQGVFAGLLVGLIMVFYLVGLKVYIWGINPGLVALICNATVIIAGSLLSKPDEVTLKNHEIFSSYNPMIKA
ncbi:MAG: sodium:solute symporter family protein [Deltaproteobacteria bacterium]|jgi:SSS family solute:Na+ symporter|nr:sodium:solute symporter family protein [Deltaproteobacteria bacterium]